MILGKFLVLGMHVSFGPLKESCLSLAIFGMDIC